MLVYRCIVFMSGSSLEKHADLVRLYEETKLKSDFSAAIPTSDSQVRARLRELGHPICLFGEDAFARRERLKVLLGGQGAPQPLSVVDEPSGPLSVFYTHGSESLLKARRLIAERSQPLAAARLERERNREWSNDAIPRVWESGTVVPFSQVGDTRPLSNVAFSHSDPLVAVAGWSGDVNVFSTSSPTDLTQVVSLRGHRDRCTSAAWGHGYLVSGGCDSKLFLWKVGESASPIQVLEGHELRVNRVTTHPTCEHLVLSTSDDETWRIWDLNKQEEILLQEGHIGGVFGLAVHPDGSLAATSDIAGVIQVWDIRTGRCIIGFEGHAEQVLGLDFSPNGYNLASCSGDNSVRIWDIRKKQCVDTLPGHEKLVSSVKYDRRNGSVLMTASYDCVAKIWRTSDFKIVKNLPIHESRIMGADLSADGTQVATACYDRTFKVWSARGGEKEESSSAMKQEE